MQRKFVSVKALRAGTTGATNVRTAPRPMYVAIECQRAFKAGYKAGYTTAVKKVKKVL